MGKNKVKTTKKLSVFKVAGGRSLKAKTKAKPVTGQLKKINEIVRKNVAKVNEQLAELQNTNDVRKRQEKPKSVPKEIRKKQTIVTEQEKADISEKLNNVKF